MTPIKTASFEFKIEGEEWTGVATIVTQGENLADATVTALNLLGSAPSMTNLVLLRVVDSNVMIQRQESVERKLYIEERQISSKVEHSGEITENRREVK